MTYDFLQHYWCFIVSLLGAILVFLLFVQGANSVARSLGYTEEGRRLVYNSTGRKWSSHSPHLLPLVVRSLPRSHYSTLPASAAPIGCG